MERIVVYSPQITNRLKYVVDWLLKERLQLSYAITTNEADVAGLPFYISYGKAASNSFSIPDTGLLWEKEINPCNPAIGEWHNIPTLFAAAEGQYTISFDIFSAVFFLLSRYEEYYPYKVDKHGRYPATSSILCKNGWLQRPLVDEWVSLMRKQLQAKLKTNIDATPFLFTPSYDIDMAYSHLYKGARRIVGAYFRALIRGDVRQISERTQVLKNKQKDPYDSFRWLRQLHKQYECKPLYFILSSFRTTAYDKNIHPQHPAMVRVIKNLAKEGAFGIHPSYYSDQSDTLLREKKMLEHIAGRQTVLSRQHYIRVKLPDTYRMLLRDHITEDYSMGYGSHLGFRAGTGSSFFWFDVQQDTVTRLRVHPFCFMDTTAHYEARLSLSESFARLDEMSRRLEQAGSTLVTVFHNFSLGTSSEWKGWRQAYEHFLQEKMKHVNAEAISG